jgi:hypothetical protein
VNSIRFIKLLKASRAPDLQMPTQHCMGALPSQAPHARPFCQGQRHGLPEIYQNSASSQVKVSQFLSYRALEPDVPCKIFAWLITAWKAGTNTQ